MYENNFRSLFVLLSVRLLVAAFLIAVAVIPSTLCWVLRKIPFLQLIVFDSNNKSSYLSFKAEECRVSWYRGISRQTYTFIKPIVFAQSLNHIYKSVLIRTKISDLMLT